eukprot:jgi/Tetstr1/442222/TSEL_003178.t1
MEAPASEGGEEPACEAQPEPPSAQSRLLGRRVAARAGRRLRNGTVVAWDDAQQLFRVKFDGHEAEEALDEAQVTGLLVDGDNEAEQDASGEKPSAASPPPAKKAKTGRAPAKKGSKKAAAQLAPAEAAAEEPEARPAAAPKAAAAAATKTKGGQSEHGGGARAQQSLKSDKQMWEHEVTHLVAPSLRRMEKTVAAMATGAWLLSAAFLDSSLMEGRVLDEESFELSKCDPAAKGAISDGAPRHWRTRRQRCGAGAFHGLRVVFYGKGFSPTADTLTRIIEAGEGSVLKRSYPYTSVLKEGVDIAVVENSKSPTDKWVKAFLEAGVACVTDEYIVEWVVHPRASLAGFYLFNSCASDKLRQAEQARGD